MPKLKSSAFWKKAPKKAPNEITYKGKKYVSVYKIKDELTVPSMRKHLKSQGHKSVIAKPLYGGIHILYVPKKG